MSRTSCNTPIRCYSWVSPSVFMSGPYDNNPFRALSLSPVACHLSLSPLHVPAYRLALCGRVCRVCALSVPLWNWLNTKWDTKYLWIIGIAVHIPPSIAIFWLQPRQDAAYLVI